MKGKALFLAGSLALGVAGSAVAQVAVVPAPQQGHFMDGYPAQPTAGAELVSPASTWGSQVDSNPSPSIYSYAPSAIQGTNGGGNQPMLYGGDGQGRYAGGATASGIGANIHQRSAD